MDLDGVRIVADPLLRRNDGILRRRGVQPSRPAWADADAVLLSHLHTDHAEVPSLKLFPGVPVLTAPANAVWVNRKGLDGRGLADDEWFPLGADGRVEVRLVRAVHHSRPMPHRPNAANGHLVRGPSGVAWLAGDTDLYDDMEALPELAGAPIDISLVPVGGWGPRLSPGHMGPKEAAVACRLTADAVRRTRALEDAARPGRRDAAAWVDGRGGSEVRRRPWRVRRPAAGPWSWTSVDPSASPPPTAPLVEDGLSVSPVAGDTRAAAGPETRRTRPSPEPIDRQEWTDMSEVDTALEPPDDADRADHSLPRRP